MNGRIVGLFFVAGLLSALPQVSAHPGHDLEIAPADSPLHLLVQPGHGIALGVVALVGIWLIMRKQKPLQLLRLRNK